MIKPLQRMIGPYGKSIKVTPLTQMIPRKKISDTSGKAFNGIVPFSLDMLRLNEIEGNAYIVPKKEINYVVQSNDMDDWSYLFKRFDSLLGNLIKLLSNIRKKEYFKINYLKLEEKMIENRHNKLQEFLLEKTQEQDDIEAKTELTDAEKIGKLKKTLAAMGFVAGGAMSGLVTKDLTNLSTGTVHKKGASIAKMLMQRYGLTDVQSAAIVGNFIRESGLTPYNVEDSSPYDKEEPLPPPYGTSNTGYGWAQWTNDRLDIFVQKFLGGGPNKRGKAANDGDNWKMLTYELDGPYKSVIQGLKGINDITQATIYAEENYEVALIKANDERINAAKGVLKEIRQMKASGGIVIPELFDRTTIHYDTFRKNNILSNFIADKPTIINIADYGEPLVIIPLGRPIGKMILKMLFDQPFKMIENKFKFLMKEKQSNKNQNSLKNSQSHINRTPIISTPSDIGYPSPATPSNSDTNQSNTIIPISPAINPSASSNTSPQSIKNLPKVQPLTNENNINQTRIDSVSKSTSNILDTEVIIFTQDITITEE